MGFTYSKIIDLERYRRPVEFIVVFNLTMELYASTREKINYLDFHLNERILAQIRGGFLGTDDPRTNQT